MPEYEQKDNDGAAFGVDQPKKEDWHDDWSGRIMVEGSMYWLGIRDMVSAAGKEYKKVRVRPMDENYTSAPSRPQPAPVSEGADIPF